MQLLPGEKLCAIDVALTHQLRIAWRMVNVSFLKACLLLGQPHAIMKGCVCQFHTCTWVKFLQVVAGWTAPTHVRQSSSAGDRAKMLLCLWVDACTCCLMPVISCVYLAEHVPALRWDPRLAPKAPSAGVGSHCPCLCQPAPQGPRCPCHQPAWHGCMSNSTCASDAAVVRSVAQKGVSHVVVQSL